MSYAIDVPDDMPNSEHFKLAQNLITQLQSTEIIAPERKAILIQQAMLVLDKFFAQTQDKLAFSLARFKLAKIALNDEEVETLGWELYDLNHDIRYLLQAIDYFEFARNCHQTAVNIAESLKNDFAKTDADKKTATKRWFELTSF